MGGPKMTSRKLEASTSNVITENTKLSIDTGQNWPPEPHGDFLDFSTLKLIYAG
jgi:hypothetical protein